ncbi:MAG: heme-dependent peroxidase [Bryobacterales bacterium]|nr:heme-dependent peroxidase [Acidobacteriota bacterium]MCB9383264.1 heme-dependent peroxidase [Bryobacterales bacterium]
MSSEHHHGPANPRARKAEPPPAPLTLDGSPVLHQMFRLRWPAWRALADERRRAIAKQASQALAAMEGHPEGGSALFAQLGHKGDLLFVHFRRSFEALHEVELQLAQLDLYEFLEPTTSYVSTVELGLYATALQAYPQWIEKGIEPGSEEWVAAEKEKIDEQAAAMAPRLYPTVPPNRYLCFYPMDKKRGEQKNWYAEPIADRGRMMRDHGMIGRRYAGKVKQIISGSIGFDDWEWGVDLFADDPLVFKQLIYEMRFDEASAWYALFGPFYIGIRVVAAELPVWLDGRPPQYGPPQSE